jgi:hypothetical protein
MARHVCMAFATTDRSTSLVPPRNVNAGV